jgi:hypothetical protein
MTPRRAFACVALIAVVATRVDLEYLSMPFVDREAHARIPLVDSIWPSYPRFLQSVRGRTSPGDSIALTVPASAPVEIYPHAYCRASYFLAGRIVLPTIHPLYGNAIPSNIAAARFVAAYGDSPTVGELLWTGEGGSLIRR